MKKIYYINKYLKMKNNFVTTRLISTIKNRLFNNCKKKSKNLMKATKPVVSKSRNQIKKIFICNKKKSN